jgi:RNA polymerase sigma factor (sigma-70 family)
MMTSDSIQLLREFSHSRSEQAFRGLVREHSPMVFATALRRLNGDNAAAQDVTQEVFTLLARKANQLESVVLGGWLYRQTCRRAADHVRAETRRKAREKAAAETVAAANPADTLDSRHLARELDDALLSLPATDRDALVLRFFEGKEYRAIGNLLGLSEEAVRKRIQRAVDGLGGSLKRKGITAGSVSLGTALESFGSAPVPAETVSQLTGTALKAAATSGGFTVAAFLKPMLAGVIATSLVTAPALALRQSNAAPVPPAAAPLSKSTTRASRVVEKLPEQPTLDQIIAEIRRIRSGPGNVLTEMRLKVALGKIQISQIPEFVALGNAQFNESERDEIFGPLLGIWWRKDHEEALDFMLEMLKGPQAPPNAFFVRSFFGKWESEDATSSHNWLFSHWDDSILRYPTFGDTLRGSLAKGAVSRMFGNNQITAIFDFISRIPNASDQAEALKALTGQAETHGIWEYSDEQKDQWLQVYRGLERIADVHCRMELTRNFWKQIGISRPTEVTEIQKFIQPSEPFAVSLGLLGINSLPSKRTTNVAGGETIQYEPVTDTDSRIEAAIQVGTNCGLSRDSVLSAIADVMREVGNQASQDWLEKHPEAVGTDSWLADLVRKEATNPTFMFVRPMEYIMNHAAKIRDPDLRRRLSRGAFRRLLASSPVEAEKFLNEAAVPPDLVEELKAIASETP